MNTKKGEDKFSVFKEYNMKANVNYSSRFRILKGGKISLVVSALLGSVTLSFAAPSGGVVTSGSATISQSGNTTNINQSTSKASINWNKFNIASHETVNFNQPNVNSITLNRVIGNERSIIDGALNANGQVWILNSNGVLFGKNASINTAGLLATTKNISDTNFQNGNYSFSGDSTESVINQGTIKIKDNGYVIFASNEVRNSGTIEAVKGRVQLTGTDEYTINLNGNSLVDLVVNKGTLDALVENSGTILADGGEIYLSTHAVDELLRGVVNNTGIIEANSLDGISGHVELFAHGGTANIDGTIKAKGGFIETSGKELNVASTTSIEASKWLLDPVNMTIESTGGTDLSGGSVSATAIQSALSSADVELQADQDITVNENITWGDATKLTLTAGDEIYINATIENTNSTNGGVFFNAVNRNLAIKFDETTGKVIINNINQLQWMNQALNGNYELGSNIDASDTRNWNSGYGFKQIGDNSTTNIDTRFTGNFDGKGHVIDGLYINRPSEDYVGLFGFMYQNTISNTGLTSVDITGKNYVGAFIGRIWAYSSLSSLYITGKVTGTNRVGGLVGDMLDSTISNSYNAATVTGTSDVGGLVGVLNSSSKIINSYAVGSVSGNQYVGGLVGKNFSAALQNSYYDIDTTGQTVGAGDGSSSGSTGIYNSTNTVNAFDEATYAGFDFTNDWIIYEGHTRPLLRAFMTELTVKANDVTRTYDGTTYSGNAGVTYSNPTYDSSLVQGSLNYTSSGDLKNAGTATINVDGLYSTTQQGYIINYDTGTLTTNKKDITANYTAENKVYDGTTSANVNGTLSGILSGDTVTLSNTSANFTDKNAGTGKTVNIAGITLGGVDSGNYFISTTNSATANILKKDITVTANSDTTTYNGTVQNTNGFSASGLVGGETVAVLDGVTGDSAGGRNAGTYNTNLSGTDENYNITFVDGSLVISKKELTANYTAENKVYDGNTDAVVNGTLSGVISGETVTLSNTSANFTDKNVGEDKTVNIAGISLGGIYSGNYSISNSSSVTADITKKGIAVNYTAENKVYDGNTDAVVNGTLIGVVSGEAVSISNTSANFTDKNAGNGKTVNIAGISLGGVDSGNYSISTTNSATADITKRALSLEATKDYDGTDDLIGFVSFGNLVGAETLEYTGAKANSSNLIANNFIKEITLQDGTNGGLASNYELPSLLAYSTNNSVQIGNIPVAKTNRTPDLSKVITPITNKTVLTNKDIETLLKSGIDIKTILQQLDNNELALIPGIVIQVLNGGINLPFGSKQEFSLNQESEEEENTI